MVYTDTHIGCERLGSHCEMSSLPELLPAHFDLQGSAGGTMAHLLRPSYAS